MVVTFFGHRNTPSEVRFVLERELKALIEREGADTFYVGEQGAFDGLVKQVLTKLKREYPKIRCNQVLTALPDSRKETEEGWETVYPEGLERVPPRFLIDRRNHWMVENADIVITYVVHCGGAAKFEKMAYQKGKRVIPLGKPV